MLGTWAIHSWLLCYCDVCNMKNLESFVKEIILMVTFLNLLTDTYGRNIKLHYPYDITTFHYIIFTITIFLLDVTMCCSCLVLPS